MRNPAPIPPDLRGRSFRTATSGLGDRRLRASDIVHPFRGIALVGDRPESMPELSAAYAPRLLPGQAFSHVSALQLWGAPVPIGMRREVHVSVLFPRTPPRAIGVIGHSLRRLETQDLGGIPLSSPAAAWCESAAQLSVPALIAAGDALATGSRERGERGPAVCSIPELRGALAARRRGPGLDRARRALPWIRSGVDSPRETELRLLLIRAGLPEPDVDVAVPAARAVVLHSDLGYPADRVVLEYEGDGHRTSRAQWMRDIRRRELMEDAGYRVVRVVADDLRDPAPLVSRLRMLLGPRV